ncbi:MAG: META domain-containing protein [Bacteroidales bacterium]|nr:META domain-containing protein [Bacteroidales bacterium]MDY2917119.1 META domain-containing protein [Muribaculaceae bacterium]
MKIRYVIMAVAAMLVCSTMSAELAPEAKKQQLGSEATPVSKTGSQSSRTATVVVSREVIPVGKPSDQKDKKKKDKKDKKNNKENKNLTAQSSEKSAPKKEEKKDKKHKKNKEHKPTVNLKELAANVKGQWTLVSIGKNGVTDDIDIPYIIFEPDKDNAGRALPTGMAYVSNGHKIINARYTLSENAVTFTGPVASQDVTKTVKYERDMNKVLDPRKSENKVKMTLTHKLNEFDLSFNDNSNRPMLSFVRHDIGFMDGKWQVNELYGENVHDVQANLCIDVAQQRIHGNTGCNYFNGDLAVTPYEPSSIDFSGMVVDSHGGKKVRQERLMLVALEEANSYLKLSDTSIALINSHGKQVMKLNLIERTPRRRR